MPTNPPSLMQVVSTDDLPEHERFPFWREVFGRSIMHADVERVNDRPFRASARLLALGDLGIAFGSTDGLRSSRSKSLLADGADDLILLANLSGICLASHRGRELKVEAGEAVMLTSAEIGSTLFPQTSHILNLRIKRPALAAVMADPEAALMRRLAANTEALRLLIDYVVMTVEKHRLAETEIRQVFSMHVHDLIALTIGANRDATELAVSRGLRATRLNAIKADIVAHLSVERLSVTDIASRHHVTPRYVQLLFEADGRTFSEYVVEQRLARAYRMLGTARFSDWTISAIAFEVGFSNLSYFNRTFRRRYGATPSDVREALK